MKITYVNCKQTKFDFFSYQMARTKQTSRQNSTRSNYQRATFEPVSTLWELFIMKIEKDVHLLSFFWKVTSPIHLLFQILCEASLKHW